MKPSKHSTRPDTSNDTTAASASSRRDFLKVAAAAGLAAPTIVSPAIFAKEGRPAPSDKVIVGSIGVGDLGRRHHLLNMLIPNKRVEVAAVCDVDKKHLEEAQKQGQEKSGKKIDAYTDFRELCDRKDIDAVLIATPDHWHALTAMYAMQSGKDVYCEKPLTYSIDEGKALVAAARRYGTVFQTGSQQRSDKRFRTACELVRNGKIGKLKRVDTYIGWVDNEDWAPVSEPPAHLDWNFWLGPAPWREYRPNQVHYKFRWLTDFSGGKLTDWGAHHLDIAQWGIGADGSGPIKVKGRGKFFAEGPFDVAREFDIKFTYPNDVELHCHSRGENGVRFTGADGWVFVSRFRIDASDKDLLNYEAGENEVRLYRSEHHHDNWLDCIMSRERPICDVEIGHRSVTVCHLGNIAVRLGRELEWDPQEEKFVNDEQASRMMWRPMRGPWHL